MNASTAVVSQVDRWMRPVQSDAPSQPECPKERMMKRSLNFVFAAVLAGGTSLASAQIGPYGSGGLGSPRPSALNPYGTGMPSATGLGSTGPLLFSPNPGAVSSSRRFGDATSPPLGSYGSSMGLGSAAPSPLIPRGVSAMANAPSSTTHFPLVNCYA